MTNYCRCCYTAAVWFLQTAISSAKIGKEALRGNYDSASVVVREGGGRQESLARDLRDGGGVGFAEPLRNTFDLNAFFGNSSCFVADFVDFVGA